MNLILTACPNLINQEDNSAPCVGNCSLMRLVILTKGLQRKDLAFEC